MQCPWCGRDNLNVYAYCQGCGRGFSGPKADGFAIAPHSENVKAWFAPPAEAAPNLGGFWPTVTALSSVALGGALIWESRSDGSSLSTPVLGALAGFTVFAVLGWALASFARPKLSGEGKTANVLTQVAVVRFATGTPNVVIERALADAVEKGSDLTKLRGFRQATAQWNGAAGGVVGITWHNGSSLPGPAEVEKALRESIRRSAGSEADAQVQAFEAQRAGPAGPPRVRMGATAALGGIMALALAGLTASAGYAAF